MKTLDDQITNKGKLKSNQISEYAETLQREMKTRGASDPNLGFEVLSKYNMEVLSRLE